MARHRARIVCLVAILLALGGTLRCLEYVLDHPSRLVILGLLVTFFVLLATVPWLTRRSQRSMHLNLAVQTCILVALNTVTTIENFGASPFMSRILAAITILPPKIAFRWIGAFILIIGFNVVQRNAGVLPNYLAILVVAVVATKIIYDLPVKRTNVTRFLFGARIR